MIRELSLHPPRARIALIVITIGLLAGTSVALAQDPVINEFVANHVGTDNLEYVEVAGAPSADLSAFTVLQIEGDATGAGVIDSALPVGTTDAAGIWVTGFLANELENGTMSLLLVEGFTGSTGTDLDTDNDGLLDVAPWSRLVDAVAVTDGGSTDHAYGGVVLASGFDGLSLTPGGASRLPNAIDTDTTSDWTRNDFDGAGIPDLDPGTPEAGEALNTPGAVNQAVAGGAVTDPVVNEFVFNHAGTDTNEYVEVAGDPATDYSAFTVLQIEGDGTGAGVIDSVFTVGTTNGDGLWFTGFLANELENGTVSLLLVEAFTGSAGDDLDTDNDGVLDTTPWDRLIDAVAVTDGGATDHAYGGVVLAPGFDGLSQTPGGASRIPNAADTDSVGDWLRNDFDGAGIPALDPGTPEPGEAFNTPEAINAAVPVVELPEVAIHEIRVDQPGADDDEYFELAGAPGAALDRLTYLVIGDGAGGSGVIENVTPLTAQTIPADGFFFAAESTITLGTPDLTTTLNFENGDNVTHLLVADFTGANGQDLDLDDDGVLDVTPWSDQLDCVALLDTAGSGDLVYCATQVGPDPAGGPGHVFLCDEGWRIGDFTLDATDTPGTENLCVIEPTAAEIFEIQGSGLVSPFAGALVVTANNVVTGVTPNGFFMQTPETRSDNDPSTSDGIFVFTSSAPGVVAGNLVTVTGTVQEFFDLTEISGSPMVEVTGGGQPLPTPVLLGSTLPSPLPPATSLERVEGMRVRMEDGISTGPSDGFGDLPVVVGHPRTFREKGIEFPGFPGRPDLPVWDGNPEEFEIDPNGLAGQPDLLADALTEISLAEGPLTFAFGDYQIFPSTLVVGATHEPFRAVRLSLPDELTVGSLNLFRLFNDINDPGPEDNGAVVSTAEYQRRLQKFSAYIRRALRSPDILAVEEAESLPVLQDLAARIAADDPSVTYTAYLVEGNDVGGIDTGFLVRARVRVDAVTQLGATELLSVDGSLLHDRPPLLLEGALLTGGEDFDIAVLAVHNRSLSGIEDPSDGPRVRQKRLEQAQSIAQKIQDFQTSNPTARLTVVGDFNAFQVTDGYVDAVGQIRGVFDPADNLLSGPDLVDPDLTDQVLLLPPEEQYSFVFDGNAQVLDHALTTVTLDPLVSGFEYGRGNSDAAGARIDQVGDPLIDPDPEIVSARRSSDHDGLVLFVFADSDDDGVANSDDLCPGTAIPESVPTQHLGIGRWALVDDDGVFDTHSPLPGFPHLSFTIEDTGGCSCEQILDATHLGFGQEKFGCSTGVLVAWEVLVKLHNHHHH